jgi:lipooligosaccharide transport system permease protein
MLTLDRIDVSLALIHIVYLLAILLLGYWWACRRLTKRLVS